MDPPAPTQPAITSPTTNPSNLAEQIFFGFLEFTPHTPAQLLVFRFLHEGFDLAFGSMRFHINTIGTVRLPDPIYADHTDLAASPIISASSDPTDLAASSGTPAPSDPTDPAASSNTTAPTDPSSSASSSSPRSVNNLPRRSTPPLIRQALPDNDQIGRAHV